MRVIAGTQKNRELFGPKKLSIRPTSNKAKKLIFDYLGEKVHNAHVLDLYSGTGNLGIEALSRGAGYVLFVEQNKSAVTIIQKNIGLTHFEAQSKIVIQEAIKQLLFLSKKEIRFNIILADPPYNYSQFHELIKIIDHGKFLLGQGVFVLEHNTHEKLKLNTKNLKISKTANMGDTAVSFFYKNE